MPQDISLVRKSFTTDSHATSYLEAGPPDGPLLIFVHGWPALGALESRLPRQVIEILRRFRATGASIAI